MDPSPILLPLSTYNVFPIDYSIGKSNSQINNDVAHELTVGYAAFLCHPMGNPI
jgi:hypothetical protein